MRPRSITNDGRTVPANVVGYDHETGFGLLRAIEPLKVKPMALGKSADVKEQRPGAGGELRRRRAWWRRSHVVARREFAGSWEYLLDEAIFTSPPHPAWSGAALINREGKLVGVGSLIVGDAAGEGEQAPGNMFVPIDRLPPILGRPASPTGACRARRGRGSASTTEEVARAAAGRPRDAGQPGGEGRPQARRRHRRRRRRAAKSAGRLLPQGLGARRAPAPPCRSTCCRTTQTRRSTSVDEPARPPEAEIDF